MRNREKFLLRQQMSNMAMYYSVDNKVQIGNQVNA